MKFEARTKSRGEHTYGVWNNDMLAWQYVDDWNGAKTLSLETASDMASKLNSTGIPFGGIPGGHIIDPNDF